MTGFEICCVSSSSHRFAQPLERSVPLVDLSLEAPLLDYARLQPVSTHSLLYVAARALHLRCYGTRLLFDQSGYFGAHELGWKAVRRDLGRLSRPDWPVVSSSTISTFATEAERARDYRNPGRVSMPENSRWSPILRPLIL